MESTQINLSYQVTFVNPRKCPRTILFSWHTALEMPRSVTMWRTYALDRFVLICGLRFRLVIYRGLRFSSCPTFTAIHGKTRSETIHFVEWFMIWCIYIYMFLNAFFTTDQIVDLGDGGSLLFHPHHFIRFMVCRPKYSMIIYIYSINELRSK